MPQNLPLFPSKAASLGNNAPNQPLFPSEAAGGCVIMLYIPRLMLTIPLTSGKPTMAGHDLVDIRQKSNIIKKLSKFTSKRKPTSIFCINGQQLILNHTTSFFRHKISSFLFLS